jgi:hypothetical protein
MIKINGRETATGATHTHTHTTNYVCSALSLRQVRVHLCGVVKDCPLDGVVRGGFRANLVEDCRGPGDMGAVGAQQP